MALQGTLKDFGIADILQLIGQQQKSGVLHLTSRDQEVTVAFKDGAIVKAETTTRKKKDLIGNMLVRAEIISEAQLNQALEMQRRTLKRLGDVLVGLKMLTKERFTEMVKLQTTETLYRLFSWKTGNYEFKQGPVDVDPADTVTIRAESVLMEGFRMVDEWPVVKKTITSYELTFEKIQELPPAPLNEDSVDDALDDAFGEEKKERNEGEFKSVGANERRLYGFVRKDRDVRKLIDLGCIGEFETCKSLLNLVNLGYLKTIQPSGRTHSIGGTETPAAAITRQVGRVAISVLVLGALAFVATRVDMTSVNLSPSPSSFADPATQRVISQTQMARIAAALDVYAVEKGHLPEKLEALVDSGILAQNDVQYPWRETYYYRRTAEGGFILLPPLR